MAQELKYYKGEAENPFEEVNEQQGAWCMRYNQVASMLWFFEYHWANGWEKYSKLSPQNKSYYFELYKQPQKQFANIFEALHAFAQHSYTGILQYGSMRWVKYVYSHAMQERFYKPIYNVVPADEVPSYLHWYRGEEQNPYDHEPNTSTKGFWWDFEYNWYKRAEELNKQAFEDYLHNYIAVRLLHEDFGWKRIPNQEQQLLMEAYTKGVARWAL